MPFLRTLTSSFIEELNCRYAKTGSWWQQLVDDPEVFIGIRKNGLNAYAGGGSVARIDWNGGRMKLCVHMKYLVFAAPVPGKPYCDLIAGEVPNSVAVKSEAEYASNLRLIKRASKMLAGGERQAECSIGTRLPCVFDIEAAYNTSKEDPFNDDDASTGSGRIDMVVVDEAGKLGGVELKLFSNTELRPRGGEVPAVCGQLIEYGNWLERNRQAVLDAYQNQAEYFSQLQGKFFADRRSLRPTTIDTTPRLLVVGKKRSTGKEDNELRKKIIAVVQEQLPTFGLCHVQFVGGLNSVRCHLLEVKGRHLLRQ